MKGFLAVFERELVERRMFAAAALGFGLVAVALPLLPGLRMGGLSPAEARGGIALGFCLLLSTLAALFLGGSVLASDLLERRIGFYFARPLSGWALWSGKVAAALVLSFGAGLLALLPAALLGSSFDPAGLLTFEMVLLNNFDAFVIWVFGLVLLFFAANAMGLIIRSRSPWAALDIVALFLVGAMIWQAFNRLFLAGVGAGSKNWWTGTISIFTWMGNIMALILLGALIAAGAVQVVLGRTDLRRAHRALSTALWGTLIVLGIAFQALTFWWVRADPSDLMGVTQVAAVPEGSSWIAFGGPAAYRPGYSPVFFYDVASGRSVPANLGPLSSWWGLPIRISADGRQAVWPVYQGHPANSPLVLQQLDLKRPGAKLTPARSSLLLSGMVEGFALSPDGRRIAIAARNRLTVENLDAGRLIASASYDGELWFSRMAFAGPDRVRLYRAKENDISDVAAREAKYDILELNLSTSAGKLEPTGSISGVRGMNGWSLSRDGERILLRTRHQLQLRNARTGELLADFGVGKEAVASFLNDGRIALVSPGGDLRIFAPDGVQELRRFHFQEAQTVVPVDQPAPDTLRVVLSRTGEARTPWDLRALDLRTGAVRSLGTRKLVPLEAPTSLKSRLSLKEGQGVVWKEPLLVEGQGVIWTEPLSQRWRVVLKN